MRSILLPLGNKFRMWACNLRILSAFLLGITIMLFYAARYVSYAEAMGQSIACFEAYIVLSSQPQAFCFLMLGGLLLLSDAPFMTPLSAQEMIRIGRKKWLIGQITYIFLASTVYFSLLAMLAFLYSSVTVGTYLLGGWSNALQILAVAQPQAAGSNYLVNFPFPEMIRTVSTNTAAFATVMLQSLYLSLVSLIILCGNLVFKTNCGWILGSCFHFINYMIVANAGFGMNMKYSLLCCTILGYQFSPSLDMPPLYCIGVILLNILLLIKICLINTNRIEPFE